MAIMYINNIYGLIYRHDELIRGGSGEGGGGVGWCLLECRTVTMLMCNKGCCDSDMMKAG